MSLFSVVCMVNSKFNSVWWIPNGEQILNPKDKFVKLSLRRLEGDHEPLSLVFNYYQLLSAFFKLNVTLSQVLRGESKQHDRLVAG